ncbi:hypothetical protein P9597_07350 [Aneurinibacillus migulanus]|uniref:hypothetical protein n=1 Tax=Aneurinibacillus migulanus TaxID=47500 RepID=UPI002E1B7FD4|nr:hypothetical protein [Aneurinibacillus migulanus]
MNAKKGVGQWDDPFLMEKKVDDAIKQESHICFLPIVSLEKLARRMPNVACAAELHKGN